MHQRKSENQRFSRRLSVPLPRVLADAIERGASARLQDKAEYTRQAILNQLVRDGINVEQDEARAA